MEAKENQSTNPQLLNAKQLGLILGLSKRQIFRLNSSGGIPRPFKIGGSIRWHSREISFWIDSGCKDRETWQYMKTAAEGGAE